MNLVADRTSFADPPFGTPMPTDMELAAAYAELKSVWKVGERFTVSGQWVHSRLRKAGVDTSIPVEFTAAQKQRIEEYYTNTPAEAFDLNMLAMELRKSKANVARQARRQGLTSRNRPTTPATRAKQRELRRDQWKDKPHPRGMKGKKHSPETLEKVSLGAKRYWATCKTFGIGHMSPENRARQSRQSSAMQAARPASFNYTRTKGGHREDLGGIYFRSSWEANYARYLNLLIKFGVVERWDFEPETFWFDGIARGTVSYKPDFRVKYKGDDRFEYVEIKGWVVSKDRTKWSRMNKYHPGVKLVIVGAKEYYAIQKKWSSAIPAWETAKSALRSAA